MRVDPKANVNAVYEMNAKNTLATAQNGLGKEEKLNQDRIEISPGADAYDELSSVKEKVIGEIEAGTSADKLRSLKAEIENGTYHISSEDIASAILGGKMGAEQIDE